MNGCRGASQDTQSSVCLDFRLLHSVWPSSTFGLICDQQLSTSCQRSWRDVAYSEETRRGIMKLKGSEAKLNPSRAPCYWCLSEIAYYLQEINIGDFKCSQTKAILNCSCVHGGSSPSRTFHNIFIHQDLLVFLVSKIESVTTKHGKDRKYCQRSAKS